MDRIMKTLKTAKNNVSYHEIDLSGDKYTTVDFYKFKVDANYYKNIGKIFKVDSDLETLKPDIVTILMSTDEDLKQKITVLYEKENKIIKEHVEHNKMLPATIMYFIKNNEIILIEKNLSIHYINDLKYGPYLKDYVEPRDDTDIGLTFNNKIVHDHDRFLMSDACKYIPLKDIQYNMMELRLTNHVDIFNRLTAIIYIKPDGCGVTRFEFEQNTIDPNELAERKKEAKANIIKEAKDFRKRKASQLDENNKPLYTNEKLDALYDDCIQHKTDDLNKMCYDLVEHKLTYEQTIALIKKNKENVTHIPYN